MLASAAAAPAAAVLANRFISYSLLFAVPGSWALSELPLLAKWEKEHPLSAESKPCAKTLEKMEATCSRSESRASTP